MADRICKLYGFAGYGGEMRVRLGWAFLSWGAGGAVRRRMAWCCRFLFLTHERAHISHIFLKLTEREKIGPPLPHAER